MEQDYSAFPHSVACQHVWQRGPGFLPGIPRGPGSPSSRVL